MPTHLLVTGGAGFIGSHLTDRWLADGGRVTVLDDLSTGTLANLAAAARSADLRVVEGSVLDAPLVRRLAADCDHVAHLASVVGVERVCADPARTLRVGTAGADVVLRAAVGRARRVLVASSSEVYGTAPPAPCPETAPIAIGPPETPRASYAVSKAWSETRALGLHARGAFEAVVVRFFNTSGPRQTAASGMVLPRFVEAALAGRPLVVHGDGRQTRCFTHVADTVEACARLLRVEGVAGRAYNVGAREEVAIGALAERVRAQLASASAVELRPHADLFGDGFADPRRRVPDTARLAAATGFEPGRPLADLVADLAAGCRAALAAV